MSTDRKNQRVLLIVGSLIAALVMLAACAAPSAPAPAAPTAPAPSVAAPTVAPAKPAEKPKVGMLWDTTHAERRVRIANLIQERAKQDGWEPVFQSANNDDKLQTTQAEAMISQGVKLLVISPVNMDTSSAIVDAAKKAGIPVIAFDRLIKNSTPDVFIGFDNDVIGDVIAKYAVEKVPKGNYALINGDQADNNAVVYRDGFLRVLKPYLDKGDIKIIYDQYSAGWDGAVALKHAENALTEQKNDIQAFLSQYDGLSNGIIQALKEQDLVGKVLVTGQDAELPALQRIVAGEQAMTVWKSSEEMAKLGADVIKMMLEGKTPPADRKLNNGTADIPAILLPVTVVDKDNMVKTVIAAGARTMDEVYANIPKDQWPKQ
jgi:D-xylose transport system substrate-binding protein